MTIKTTKWDVTEFLDNEKRIALFLEAVFEDGAPTLITAALGDIARARGMTAMAKETGITREALYRALSKDGRPEFNTIIKVLKSFGLRLAVRPAKNPATRPKTKRKALVSAA